VYLIQNFDLGVKGHCADAQSSPFVLVTLIDMRRIAGPITEKRWRTCAETPLTGGVHVPADFWAGDHLAQTFRFVSMVV
jgi:hypothetical protein